MAQTEGQGHEAFQVLSALNEKQVDERYIQDEFIESKYTALKMSNGKFSDLFTMDENRHFHRTVLAYVNQMFQ